MHFLCLNPFSILLLEDWWVKDYPTLKLVTHCEERAGLRSVDYKRIPDLQEPEHNVAPLTIASVRNSQICAMQVISNDLDL